ncbi:MAG: mechanosensitive ion channel family protein [Marinilabiliaceae bacterium]|nr:mechanosensitive ion channel family protein [Marinilabiliaceae bacterium]
MKRIVKSIFLVIFCFQSLSAQLSNITDNLFGTKNDKSKQETADISSETQSYSDSLEIEMLKQQLQEMKLNELFYIEELEKTRLSYLSDSIRQHLHKTRIDSLRHTTHGVPLVIIGDTLFQFYASHGGISPHDRAIKAEEIIMEMGKTRSVRPDSIYLFPIENIAQIEIMYKDRLILSVTNDDALWMDMSLELLADSQKAAIVETLKILQKKNSWLQLLKRISLFILVLAVQYVLFRLTNRLYRKFKTIVIKNTHTKFKPIVIRDYELFNTKTQTKFVVFLGNILRWILILLQLLITVPILFSIFPQTKEFANILFGYILTPAKSIFFSIIEYIPNLFIIAIIWLSIRYLVKGLQYVAKEISSERLKITGFFADWAMPTFHILKFLLYAFMIAMVYNYLPGSDEGAFQGVSIFIGLIVSLGSTSVVANVMAGLVITYMRPFKVGDRIKLNDVVGNVLEKTPFVTRLKTPKNEVITIPNSLIMTSHTTNYSASARDFGLILHSNVSIGYDIGWKQAHELLIKAAKLTDGIIQDREPFVLDLKLDDYYNTYQINVYISDADMMPKILTALHSNIQDIFTAEGISLDLPMLVTQKKENN